MNKNNQAEEHVIDEIAVYRAPIHAAAGGPQVAEIDALAIPKPPITVEAYRLRRSFCRDITE
jgi:hypothetical protein